MELGDHELLLAMNRYGCAFVSHGILICAQDMDRDGEWVMYMHAALHIDANSHELVDAVRGLQGELTAWPRLRGWISRNAKTFSLSKSLKEGMSPIVGTES